MTIFQIGHKIGSAILNIGNCLIHPWSTDWILFIKPRQKAFYYRLFFLKTSFLDSIEGWVLRFNDIFQMEKLVDIHHALNRWLCIIQLLSFRNRICQISADVCPACCPFGIRNFVVTTVTITHQISLESLKEFYCVIPGTGFWIFIKDDWESAIFPAAE